MIEGLIEWAMDKITPSRGRKSEAHIYYLREVKKVEGLSTTLVEAKVRSLQLPLKRLQARSISLHLDTPVHSPMRSMSRAEIAA